MIPILSAADRQALEKRLLSRSQLDDPEVVGRVQRIVADVRARGDEAVLEYTLRFDGVALSAEHQRVTREEIEEAYVQASSELVEALRDAARNITAFHEKQKQRTWIDFEEGKALGQLVQPLSSAGVYVPGGTAGYPSSVLMNVLPAKVAGVPRVVMATPPGKDGRASCPLVLVAADIAGVEEIYKVGGAQAIAALAFGTRAIPRVEKITGPGNIYVANAKREVFGHVGIDMIAGPSEVLIIADDGANPRYVAADMLSQAEHDPLAAAIVITVSEEMARAVAAEAERQLALLPRREIAQAAMEAYGTVIIAASVQEAIGLANDIAPEHLELCLASPFEWLGQVRNAGAVFLGAYAPEPLGDYFAGPNHTLPTSGTARFFSPLSVDDFVKKTSVIYYDRTALAAAAGRVELLARSEGLDAHARAVAVRFEEDVHA